MNKHISHRYRISTITFSNGITSHNRPCSTSHHHHATTLITCCHGRQNLPSQPFPSCPCHLYHPNPHPRQIRYKKRKLSNMESFFLISVGRFALADLLHGKERPSKISPEDWTRIDFLLQSWIYGTIQYGSLQYDSLQNSLGS